MVATIKQTIMRRDNITEAEADELITEAKEQFQVYLENNDYMGAEDICNEYFGLEPDYLDEFLF